MHSRQLVPSLAGSADATRGASTPLPATGEDGAVEQVVASLSKLCRSAALEFALAVGSLIVNELYGGDLSAWRSRGPKTTSFRKLAKHPNLPISPGALYRSVAIYELSTRLGITDWKHLSMSHLRLVLPLSEDEQLCLLRRADEESWPLRRLEREVVSLTERRTADRLSRGGRPRRSGWQRQLFELERVLCAFSEFEAQEDPSPESARLVLEAVERIRLRCAELEPRMRCRLPGAVTEPPPQLEATRTRSGA